MRARASVSLAAHADGGLVLLQHGGVGGRSILHSAIRVMYQARRRSPLDQCHVQRSNGQLGFQSSPQGPADHAPRESIQDDRQVHKLDPQSNVGDIRHPKLG